jgi:Rrf2 family nitric oxide-sensitive transcriptional repressor
VTTVRGRNGGLKLGAEPADINIGNVVRQTETDFQMAECFHRENSRCVYASACVLEDVLGAATAAYLRVLDGVTLDKLVIKKTGIPVAGITSQPVTFLSNSKITNS